MAEMAGCELGEVDGVPELRNRALLAYSSSFCKARREYKRPALLSTEHGVVLETLCFILIAWFKARYREWLYVHLALFAVIT